MQTQAIHKLLAIIIGSILIAACGPSSMGYTVPEFESAVEKLYGKSKDDVIKVFGQPKTFSQNESNGKPFDCFSYEGVKSELNGKLSRATTICFLDGKLLAQKPAHSF